MTPRSSVLLAAVSLAACGPFFSPNDQIQIDYNTFASDETGQLDGGVCVLATIGAQGAIKEKGTLELLPSLNPNPEYVLELQVENDAAVSDSANDFHVEKATINYLDIEQAITSFYGAPIPSDEFFVSADIKAGTTGIVSIAAVGANETLGQGSPIIGWIAAMQGIFSASGFNAEDIVLEVQLTGTVGSGSNTVTSSVFHFPILVCVGCGGVTVEVGPDAGVVASCPVGQAMVAVGHGPCCAAQDFYAACVPCGGQGQTCCPTNTGGIPCDGQFTCNPPASGGEVCPNIPLGILGESDTCGPAA